MQGLNTNSLYAPFNLVMDLDISDTPKFIIKAKQGAKPHESILRGLKVME